MPLHLLTLALHRGTRARRMRKKGKKNNQNDAEFTALLRKRYVAFSWPLEFKLMHRGASFQNAFFFSVKLRIHLGNDANQTFFSSLVMSLSARNPYYPYKGVALLSCMQSVVLRYRTAVRMRWRTLVFSI